MAKLMMCLSCGANFKTEQEAIEHNEKYLKLEQETRYLLTDQTVTRFATNSFGVLQELDAEERPQYIPAHVVQISHQVGG